MILVDSSVWIDHLNGARNPQVALLQRLAPSGTILIGDLILLEVLSGARSSAHARTIERALGAFDIEALSSPALAVSAATHYRALRDVGVTVRKTVDLIIGTFCIEHGHMLLHRDRDFAPMALHLGLRVVEARDH